MGAEREEQSPSPKCYFCSRDPVRDDKPKGEQNILPQICLFALLNYLNESHLRKQPADPLWSPPKHETNLPCERCPPCIRRVEGILATGVRNLGPRKLCKQVLLLLHKFSEGQPPLSCQLFTSLLFSRLKGTKTACFVHFYEPHVFMGLPYINN